MCSSVAPAVGAPDGAKLSWIRIATFNSQTAGRFKQELSKANEAGAGAIVLDLRNNGGGSFQSGVQVRWCFCVA